MIKIKEDLTGWRLRAHGVIDSRLTVLKRADDYIRPNGRAEARWLCVCDCGSAKLLSVSGAALKSGYTLSCGCLGKERAFIVNKKQNIYNLTGPFGIGIASNCQEEFYFDLTDYDRIKEYCWYKDHSTGYMKTRTPDNKWIYLHRFIVNNKYSLVDHINQNKLDNRK